MLSTYEFVRRAVDSGKRMTINDHMTLQKITEHNARKSKRTIMHRELKEGGLYHDHLGSIFVPSKGGRGRLPDIADLVQPEDDTLSYTPSMSRHLTVLKTSGYTLPATAERVAISQAEMMTLPLSKQAVITDGFLAQQNELEIERVKREAAEREAKFHADAATRIDEALSAMTSMVKSLLPSPGEGGEGSNSVQTRRTRTA